MNTALAIVVCTTVSTFCAFMAYGAGANDPDMQEHPRFVLTLHVAALLFAGLTGALVRGGF